MEWLQENPGHPPKRWMRHCVAGASGSARDPGAACGALWYHKMSESQRRAALAKERKLEANQAGDLFVPMIVGAGLLAGILWWVSSSKAAPETATGPLPPPPAPLPPAAVACDVDATTLKQWGQSLGVSALYAPGISLSCVTTPNETTCPTADEVRGVLTPDIVSQLDSLPSKQPVLFATKGKGYWEFWYWENDSVRGALRQDLYQSYCQNFGQATVQGHPANFFLF
jgi:hypothetical protein